MELLLFCVKGSLKLTSCKMRSRNYCPFSKSVEDTWERKLNVLDAYSVFISSCHQLAFHQVLRNRTFLVLFQKSHHMIPGHIVNSVNCSLVLVSSTCTPPAFKNAHNEKYRGVNYGECSLGLPQAPHNYCSALLFLLFHLDTVGNRQLEY